MEKSKLFKKSLKIFFPIMTAIFIYSYSPYKLEFLGYYSKIWAHRANSIEKLNSALNYYKGVELDLVYDEEKDFFDINHEPEKSINLNFETYIKALETPENFEGLWLDIKNLDENNADKIAIKILEILKIKNIATNNVLIETRYPEALPFFTKHGFKTSYYLPYFLYKKTKKELNEDILKIEKILESQPSIAISSSHKDYEIMCKYFPNRSKYIWALVWPVNLDFFLTRKILKDKNVKVVLVHYKALKGNR